MRQLRLRVEGGEEHLVFAMPVDYDIVYDVLERIFEDLLRDLPQ